MTGGLLEALGLERPQTVAIAGSGGKTTLMYALAAELGRAGQAVIVTTTTRIYPPGPDQAAGPWLIGRAVPQRGELASRLAQGSPLCLAAELNRQGKLTGLAPPQLAALAAAGGWTLVEADGAAGRPLKGWAEHEPVWPEGAAVVIVVAGASALGRPLDQGWVHRPERFARAAGLGPGRAITPAAVVRALTGPQGPLRRLPPGARAVALVNQADAAGEEDLRALERSLADAGAFERVLAMSLRPGPGA